jgi:hypothetical protein
VKSRLLTAVVKLLYNVSDVVEKSLKKYATMLLLTIWALVVCVMTLLLFVVNDAELVVLLELETTSSSDSSPSADCSNLELRIPLSSGHYTPVSKITLSFGTTKY